MIARFPRSFWQQHFGKIPHDSSIFFEIRVLSKLAFLGKKYFPQNMILKKYFPKSLGIVLGSSWDHSGVILGSFLDYFSIVFHIFPYIPRTWLSLFHRLFPIIPYWDIERTTQAFKNTAPNQTESHKQPAGTSYCRDL